MERPKSAIKRCEDFRFAWDRLKYRLPVLFHIIPYRVIFLQSIVNAVRNEAAYSLPVVNVSKPEDLIVVTFTNREPTYPNGALR